jgi:hypothetical protein
LVRRPKLAGVHGDRWTVEASLKWRCRQKRRHMIKLA